jgi:hypothetical protein
MRVRSSGKNHGVRKVVKNVYFRNHVVRKGHDEKIFHQLRG